MVQVQNDPAKQLLTVQWILLELTLSTKTVLYAPMHPNQRKEYPSATRSAPMFCFCKNEYVLEAEKGVCRTMSLTYFINCLRLCVKTLQQPGILRHYDMLPRISALPRGYLLYSALARTQVVWSTEMGQYFNFYCYYCVLPTRMSLSLATPITCLYSPNRQTLT